MLEAIVSKYVDSDDLLFVLSNHNDAGSNSSDTDIYCVTSGRSSVHLFYDEDHEWIELFIDSLNDLEKKIANVDEIAINFVRELQFNYGDKKIYETMLSNASAAASNYTLPDNRRNILKYRIKVLLSKYLNPGTNSDQTQENFMLSTMVYPMVQLVFAHHKIFPSSPKRWIKQLEQGLPEADFLAIRNFINRQCDREAIISLCDKYAGSLSDINLDKGTNNSTTFIS